MTDKVLVIGSGGREHCLAWKLAQSSQVAQVLVAPGNAGTANSEKITNMGPDVPTGNYPALASWCQENCISLVVVGPEAPLAAGIADDLAEAGIPCFGPSRAAAEIESSKVFAKSFMDNCKIPTARWKSFTEVEEACKHINTAPYKALVVKANGLAAGKGVVVASSTEEACDAVRNIIKDKLFGAAGESVIIEELLEGEEVSVLAFCDGSHFESMLPAQDHKRVGEGDHGPNTGGMGAYCPCPQVSRQVIQQIDEEIIQRAVDGMKEQGRPYKGVLYAGLMITKDGPSVLEFNCRFGDPETQVVLPLLKSDLYATMKACVTGDLPKAKPSFHDDRCCVAIVQASGGYPASYKKGYEISGLDEIASQPDMMVIHAGTAVKDGKVVTSGGRVLAVVASARDLVTAAAMANKGAKTVKFEGSFHRTDIAKRACDFLTGNRSSGLTYSGSGVDITAGNSLVQAIKPLAKATARPGCDAALGGFGGLFDVRAAGYKDPILVSGTDGVGTKLKIAQACNLHQTIGQDLVAMCVNDILAHGAESLFFLDYFSCGKLEVGVARDVVGGVAKGCKMAGCALLGGETAEMPGMYAPNEYDLAGFAVGAVERGHMLPRVDEIQAGDVILGVASSGIHSNGYSLVRRLVEQEGLDFKDPCPFRDGTTLGEALLTPTRIYSKTLLPAIRSGCVKAFAHITGGGLLENIPRIMPGSMAVQLDASKWEIPSVFGWISHHGGVEEMEMARTFNCGVGGVLVVRSEDEGAVLEMVRQSGETAWKIGQVMPKCGDGAGVSISNLSSSLARSYSPAMNGIQEGGAERKMRVAVLISGTGTNLQALINHTKDPKKVSRAEICLVISNIPDVLGLERAKKAGIPTKVICHKGLSRVDFDMKVHDTLQAANIEFICLAGFMRILSGEFVNRWHGRLINIHPSLLPSFKGMNAHKMVLEAGVRLSGCSVHYVVEEVDAGAILVQESVPVLPGDTEPTLQERVKTAEHVAYPRALELIARGQASLGTEGKVVWKLDS
ncbi:trifunctional purine biosynthetic protein adenosine-3-like [Lytechinus pictus]|uniref:trifunctional purine biosynthetic protein adenosine-3-like n=1 Tax=Lytechinus pictus TaxID=7653 RepID=UPI0030BA0285